MALWWHSASKVLIHINSVMSHCLLSARSFSYLTQPMLTYCQVDHGEYTSMRFESKHENFFRKLYLKMSSANVFCQWFYFSFNVFRSCYSICLPLMRHHLFCGIGAVIESVIYSYGLGHLSWPIGDWLQSNQGHKWCLFWLSLGQA